jgi:hypothetical protein
LIFVRVTSAFSGHYSLSSNHRFYVQIGHKKDVTLVTAELGQGFGLTDSALLIEGRELSLIRGMAFF